MNIVHPEISLAAEEEQLVTGVLHPIYPSTEKLKARGLDSRGIARLMRTLLTQVSRGDVPEFLPENILQKYRLPSRYDALQQVHFPTANRELELARQRLKFEELFFIHKAIQFRQCLVRHSEELLACLALSSRFRVSASCSWF